MRGEKKTFLKYINYRTIKTQNYIEKHFLLWTTYFVTQLNTQNSQSLIAMIPKSRNNGNTVIYCNWMFVLRVINVLNGEHVRKLIYFVKLRKM